MNVNIHETVEPSGRHPRVLRDAIAKPFPMVFQKSWLSDEVPSDWRKGNIAPLFEKGRKENPGND